MLKEVCEKALNEGLKINLDNCLYQFNDKRKNCDKVPRYYYFLAGFIKIKNIKSILEFGTYNGGSSIAMNNGFNESNNNKIVTVDLTSFSKERLNNYKNIKRIQGNILDEKIFEEVIKNFEEDIDLVFIDSDHEYSHVKKCIETYVNKLNPKYVIFDDIHLNSSMNKLWNEISQKYNTFDISELLWRGNNCGIGIMEYI